MRLLLVEDSKFDARLIETFLSMADFPRGLDMSHVVRLSEARAHLAEHPVDCVLLDLGLPDGEGLANIAANCHSLSSFLQLKRISGDLVDGRSVRLSHCCY